MSNTFDKQSVLEPFIEEVKSYLPEIETNLERLAPSSGDMDTLEETYRLTHTIGGSASMMDFPSLAHVAHGMEDILGDALDGLTTLDEPTIGLLRRSLGRLHQLLEGIRNGVDEEAVVKEDDADYNRYRAGIEASIQPVSNEITTSAENNAWLQELPVTPSLQPSFDIPAPFSHPSLDEVLELFHAPVALPGYDVAWPEEPAPVQPAHFELPAPFEFPVSSTFVQAPPSFTSALSALGELVASARQASAPSTPYLSREDDDIVHPVVSLYVPDESEYTQAYVTPSDTELVTKDQELPLAYEDMQKNTQELVVQASSLKSMLTQLRTVISVVETQRSEFKGFLDGSKDALDRMEDWAGQAMGLNLRNSPEQVRRYLPLSVMWVTNSKLKKVLDLLHQITGGVEVTDEQLETTLQQLQGSLVSCREIFLQMQVQSSQSVAQEPGWTDWDVQVTRDASALRERVTLERYGDPVALRAEIEASVREELRHEYESRPLTVAMRSELEQQIREELRQEAQQRQPFQDNVVGVEENSALQEYKVQLRHEIEIQVRQDFLKQIANTAGDINNALYAKAASSTSVSSDILDRTQEATGLTSTVSLAVPPSSSSPFPLITSTPTPSAGSKPASVYTFGGDFGEEAAEIFREEAEGYLQTISVHIAALEKDPTNCDLLQGVRRVMHTLKGAAGMMGFHAIADLCHVSEDLLDRIMDGTIALSSTILSIILDTAEALDTLVTGRGLDGSANEVKLQELHARYAESLGELASVPHRSVDEYIDVDGSEDLIADTLL